MTHYKLRIIPSILILFISVNISIFVLGQEASHIHNPKNARLGETIEYCHQHTMMEAIRVNDPVMYQHMMVEQSKLKEHTKKYIPEKAETIYTIPIVFHILHNAGSENISDEQVFDAVRILNEDYRKMNPDAQDVITQFKNLPADIEIEFALATIAPDGTCFNGITRTQSLQTKSAGWNGGEAQFETATKGNDIYRGTWPHDKYLNIIVAQDIGGAAGYTFKPSGGAGYFNSIFILHNYVGSIGTGNAGRSRALTHEIGHWLNLSHTWGDNNDPGMPSSCSQDDGIADTPNTIGVTSCKLHENTCGPLANVENYMDYSYCSKMFTPGQKNMMRAALNSSTSGRNKIWKESNLIAVGVKDPALCKVDFVASNTSFCAGETVKFTDKTVSIATGWLWTFEGGTPSTSTEQNPSVIYALPGQYKVTLQATHQGETKTATKTQYINVLSSYSTLPYHEGFEYFPTIVNPTMKLFVENIGDPITYEITNNASFTGKRSLKLDNFNQTNKSIDNLISTPINLLDQEIGNVGFSYRYAHRRKNANNKEFLRAYFSKGCDAPWLIRTLDNVATLNTPIESSAWTPQFPEDWTTVHIPFNTVAYKQFLTEDFRFKLEFTANGGNNLYIDDINLYQGYQEDIPITNPLDSIDFQKYLPLLGINDNIQSLSDFTLYPNPSYDEINVQFATKYAQSITIFVMDLTGKIINQSVIFAQEGRNVVLIDCAELAKGMYMAKINANNSSKMLTFVKN